MDLSEILVDFEELLKRVSAFVDAREKRDLFVRSVSSRFYYHDISEPMVVLAKELARIRRQLLSLNRGCNADEYEVLYTHVAPLFRKTEMVDERRIMEGFFSLKLDNLARALEDDPITVYSEAAMGILRDYSDGDLIFGSNLAQDALLVNLVDKLFEDRIHDHVSLANAPPEMVASAQEFMRSMKVMYDFGVEQAITDYAFLLGKIESFCEEHGTFNQYEAAKPRIIPSLRGDSMSKSISPAANVLVKKGGKTFSGPALKLLKTLATSDDWGNNIQDLIEYQNSKDKGKENDPLKTYQLLELVGDYQLVGVKSSGVSIADVIGQQDNVKQLGRLIYSFSSGNPIPAILLKGGPGVGKTLSMKAVVGVHKDLRMVLIQAEYLSSMSALLDHLKEIPYRTVAYVDDLQFGPFFNFGSFNTAISGMTDWPDNVALVGSMNPENFKGIPDSAKGRLGVILDYGNTLPASQLENVFESICRREGLQYSSELYLQFTDAYKKNSEIAGGVMDRTNSKAVPNGREMETFIRMQRALAGIDELNLPPELR